tara:strand:+ start:69 stop:332 length:264 start_codon:yes stop_codon:yes gene_type:complete
MIKLEVNLKYFLLITKINKIIALNQEQIVVAIGIIIKPTCEKNIKLITTFKITETKEYLKGVLVSFLANKKVENILIRENAGRPKEK